MSTIQDLKHGDKFKIGSQRKFRTFNELINIDSSPSKSLIGKTLVLYDGCKQMLLSRNQEISKHNPVYFDEDNYPYYLVLE